MPAEHPLCKSISSDDRATLYYVGNINKIYSTFPLVERNINEKLELNAITVALKISQRLIFLKWSHERLADIGWTD